MNCRPLVVLLFVLTMYSQNYAQPLCGFDKLHNELLRNDPQYRRQQMEQDILLKQYIESHPHANKPGERGTLATLYTIPVVVHVVHTGGAVGTIYNPDNATIQGAIDYLNQFYNGTAPGIEGVGDIQIQFVLAQRDPNCNPSNGITRDDGSGIANYVSDGVNSPGGSGTGVPELTIKNIVRWDPQRYYNIWVVNKIDANDGTSGSFIGGWAYMPPASATLDGVVMLATQMATGKKTLPHEMGHAFSLYHPFQNDADPTGATCSVNTTCNAQGDRCCDTDPVTLPAGFVCRTGDNPCFPPATTQYSINTEHNIMNYTNCFTLFTADQKARMLASAASSSRAGLSTSWGLSPSYPVLPYTPPVAASCTPTTSAGGLSGNFDGIMAVTIDKTLTQSSTARIDGGYLNKTGSCLNLVQLTEGNTYNFTVSVLGSNPDQLRAWIDYNNDGVFNNATEQIYINNNIPAGAGFPSVTTSFSVPLTAVKNTVLRLRVIDEIVGFGVITSGCYNPNFGQGEDYPVYVLAAGSMPVQFAYFKAGQKNSGVMLNWKTATELNTREFVIEHAVDGANFSAIGKKPAVNSELGSVYDYFDPHPSRGINFYRLKEIDQDGAINYTQIVSVNILDDLQSPLMQANNPFHNTLDIHFTSSFTHPLQVNLFDAAGKKIFSNTFQPSRSSTLTINLGSQSLSNGIYILQVMSNDRRFIQKLVRE